MKNIATAQACTRSGVPADALPRVEPRGGGRTAPRLAALARTAAALLVGLLGAGLAGCASLGLGGDRADAGARAALANPPRLHDDAAADAASREAARRQINSYYAAMQRAEQAYGATPAVAAERNVAVGRYVAEGIGLVDSYCLRWFEHLEDFERHADARKKDYNVISALGTALIGIAKLHPDVTAVYGAANTAYTGWSDNQQQALVIAPSSRGVKNKVMTVMQERAAQIRARADSIEFPEARHALESYADLCTYTSAKDLVDVSVAAATPEVSPAGQFTVVSTATFAPDQSSALLRKLWKPDGHTIDAKFQTKLREWLAKREVGVSITSFLNGGAFAPLRQRALSEIDLNSP